LKEAAGNAGTQSFTTVFESHGCDEINRFARSGLRVGFVQ
jgi:hypothetical protein